MIIDAHIHIVGNGSAGTGCWLRPPGLGLPMAAWMLKHVGLPLNTLKGDMDRLRADAQAKINQLQERIKELNQKLLAQAGKEQPGMKR